MNECRRSGWNVANAFVQLHRAAQRVPRRPQNPPWHCSPASEVVTRTDRLPPWVKRTDCIVRRNVDSERRWRSPSPDTRRGAGWNGYAEWVLPWLPSFSAGSTYSGRPCLRASGRIAVWPRFVAARSSAVCVVHARPSHTRTGLPGATEILTIHRDGAPVGWNSAGRTSG